MLFHSNLYQFVNCIIQCGGAIDNGLHLVYTSHNLVYPQHHFVDQDLC